MKFWPRFALGIRLYLQNSLRIIPVVLIVWLPADVMINLFLPTVIGETSWLAEWLFDSLIAAFLLPLEIAAVLFILDNYQNGRSESVVRVMLRGVRSWLRVFAADQIAGIFILLGLFLFIVPGIVLMLRYALTPATAAFDREWPFGAMRRSRDLTEGLKLQILGTAILITIAWLVVHTILCMPLYVMAWDLTLWGAILADVLADVLMSVLYIYIYLFCVEGRQRERDEESGVDETAAPELAPAN